MASGTPRAVRIEYIAGSGVSRLPFEAPAVGDTCPPVHLFLMLTMLWHGCSTCTERVPPRRPSKVAAGFYLIVFRNLAYPCVRALWCLNSRCANFQRRRFVWPMSEDVGVQICAMGPGTRLVCPNRVD